MLFCAVGVVIATQLHPAFVPAAYFAVYLVLGVVEAGVILARRVAIASSGGAAALEDDDDDELAGAEDKDAGDVDEQDYL
jgi:hypothetical protein